MIIVVKLCLTASASESGDGGRTPNGGMERHCTLRVAALP
jgi:hypothetical protein